MKLLARVAVVCVLLSSLTSARGQDVAGLAARGKELMAAERFAEAIPVYRELVKALPDNPGPLMNLGMALHMSGQEKEAAARFEQVIKLQPQHWPAQLFLGAAYMGLGAPGRAVVPLETVVRTQPRNPDVRMLLGQAYLSLERYQSAAEQFKRLSQLDPDNPKAWNGLGLSYERLANRNFVALEKIALGSPLWRILVAEARAAVGLYTRAFLLYREAQEKLPQMSGIHKAVAEIYRKIDQPQWAAAEEEKERGLPSLDCRSATKATVASRRAVSASTQALECEFWAGRYEQVIRFSRGRQSEEALFWRTRAYNELARAAFTRLAQLPPSAQMHELLATLHFNRKNYSDSANEWRAALKLAPGNPFYRERLAICLSASNDFEGARQILGELVQLAPNSPDINYWLGFTLLGLLEPEKAIPLLEKVVKADPSLPAGHKELARAYMQAGQPEKAIPHLKAALVADEDGSIHYQLSIAYRNVGQREQASLMLQKFREMEEAARGGADAAGRRLEITPP